MLHSPLVSLCELTPELADVVMGSLPLRALAVLQATSKVRLYLG